MRIFHDLEDLGELFFLLFHYKSTCDSFTCSVSYVQVICMGILNNSRVYIRHDSVKMFFNVSVSYKNMIV